MNWNPSSLARRARDVPSHLGELAGHLRDLASRVRDSVADKVGTTVSVIVRDTLQKLWKQPDPIAPLPSQSPTPTLFVTMPDGYDWNDEDLQWALREMPPELLESLRLPTRASEAGPASPSSNPPRSHAAILTKAALVALLLRSSGWWLPRHGSWFGAVGAGLVVGAIGVVGGPLALSCLGLAEAATELIALNALMTRWNVTSKAT